MRALFLQPILTELLSTCLGLVYLYNYYLNTAVSLVHAFVFSRFDYCSSIFAGLPGVRLGKLRWVHRIAAPHICEFGKFDHIALYMRDVLHWLPSPHRISYSIAYLVVAVLFWLGALRSARAQPPSLFLCRPSNTAVLCSR